MGLDMYLEREQFVSSWGKEFKVTVEDEDGKLLAFNKFDKNKTSFMSMSYAVGYWRKANHIHNWFIQHCADNPDQQRVRVTIDDLQNLLDTCKKVKEASKLGEPKEVVVATIWSNGESRPEYGKVRQIEDSSVAEELLPTCDGFFFGSQSYDEYYLDDINNTIEILTDVLATDSGDDYWYVASY